MNHKLLTFTVLTVLFNCSPAVLAAESGMPMHEGHVMSPMHGIQHEEGAMHKRFDDPERLAKNFDNPERNAWQKPDQVLDVLNLAPNSSIADIGAGTGYFSSRLAKRLPAGKVFAVDIEPNMVTYLAERAKRDKLSNIEAVQGAADSPNLPKAVDTALFVNAYHLIGNRVEYFKKFQQSLTQEGRLVIVDWKMNAHETPPKMRLVPFMTALHELSQAGYELVELRDFLPRQYIAIYKKSTQPMAGAMGMGPQSHMMHAENGMAVHMQHGDGAYHHSFSDAEKWAKQFDNPERDQWQKPEQVLDALDLEEDALVADLGAGTGYFSSKIAKRLSKGKVFAVDAEADMVSYLSKRAQQEGLSNLQAIQGGPDSANLPEPVDLILLVDVYHHIGHRVEYFKKLAASLKSGGRLALIDFREAGPGTPPKEHIVTLEQATDELAAAGFKRVETHDFLAKQYFAVFEK